MFCRLFNRMWLSARRTKWVHEKLETGLLIHIPDDPETTADKMRISVNSKNASLLVVPGTRNYSVVCVNDNITSNKYFRFSD